MARFPEQHDAIVGQRHAAGGAGHQPGAEVVLEQPDVTAERGGQHVEPLRGAAEMQLFGGRDEAAELVQFHACVLPSADYIKFLYNHMPVEGAGRPDVVSP